MSMSESKQAYYEKLVYNELMTRELVNYDRVLAKSETLDALSDRQKDRTVSAYSDYNVLKKAFIVVIDLLKLVEGAREAIKQDRFADYKREFYQKYYGK